LDTDGSGAISREEFQSKGQMAFVLSGPKNNELIKYKPREGGRATMVKFHIESERIRSGIYRSDEKSIKDVERIVYWHKGGGVSAMNGSVKIDIGNQVDVIFTDK
jgi:hypothetical protein